MTADVAGAEVKVIVEPEIAKLVVYFWNTPLTNAITVDDGFWGTLDKVNPVVELSPVNVSTVGVVSVTALAETICCLPR